MAFYGLDLLLRMIRVRVKDASLHACDNQMTVVRKCISFGFTYHINS